MEQEGTATTRPLGQSYIIKRPRLTKLLDDSEARIILLVAPAGYGKTTLAREWLGEREGVAWYRGRPAIADVAALASGLVAALATDDDSRDRAIERVEILATRSQPPEVLAKTVASAVSGSISMLVIDDCHHASSPDSEALLTALTLDTPLRVLLISRTRPAWVTPRMVIYGDAIMLEMADLAFTNEEACSVIGHVANEAPTDLVSRARGWPAVIGLAVQRGRDGLQETLPSNDLYDFFAEDLFHRATPDLQQGLILLALGGDTNIDVARTMLGDRHEAILLAALEHGFLGQRSGELEIHPLLRTFLLDQLDHLSTSDAKTTLGAAIEVLAANELWDECLAALQSHPVKDLISSILNESLADLLASGRIATVRRWVDLARSNRVSNPMLLLAEAEIALRDRDDARAQTVGAQAGALLGCGDAAARAYIVAARAAHFRDDVAAVKRYTELASSSAVATDLKTTALWIAFANASERSQTEAKALLDRLDGLSDTQPEHTLRLLNAHGLMLTNSGGDVRAVAARSELARALIPHVRDPFATTNALNIFAHVAVLTAQYESALSLAAQLLEEARSAGLDFALDHALLTRASALIGLRRLAAAQSTLNEIEDQTGRRSAHIVTNAQIQEIRLRITSGDLERASHLIQREPPRPLPFAIKTEFLAYRGLVLTALGEVHRAEDAFRAAARFKGYIDARFLCDLGRAALALTQEKRGSEAHCVTAVLRTMDEGYLDAVVMAARAIPDLVRAVSADDACARALTLLLSSSSDIDLGRQAGLHMPRVLRRHESLSRRERDVYELIVQGRSNKAIARTLFISESTTKVHVRHIFEKLGVHTRAEVARTSLEDRLL